MNLNQQPYAKPQTYRLDEEKKAIVVEYMPLVKFIAQRIKDKLPSHVELDDLEHAGMLGLMEAVCRYDDSHSNLFKTYAEHRIRGAILDDLRKNDFMTRTGREKYKLLEKTIMQIEKNLHREATSDEIAEALGMKMEEYFDFLSEAKVGVFISLEETIGGDGAMHGVNHDRQDMSSAEKKIWMDQVKVMLAQEIDKLKKDEKIVLSLYYYEELTLREIGEVMEKTESRICQIHNDVMAKLARRLKKRVNFDEEKSS